MVGEVVEPEKNDDVLLSDVSRLIEETQDTVAKTINSNLTRLYWRVGKRILQDVLRFERAEYGKQILHTLSAKLTQTYGRGWSAYDNSCRQYKQPTAGKR